MRDRGAEAQQHRASGLALVTAAIVLWNTVYLGRALDALRRDDIPVPAAVLAHLAPLGWRHINLTGDCLGPATANFNPTVSGLSGAALQPWPPWQPPDVPALSA